MHKNSTLMAGMGPYLGLQMHTVNGESFTELNFCSFRGFSEKRESFPMNLLLQV